MRHSKHVTLYALIFSFIFLFSLIVPSVLATDFHVVKGSLYIDDVIAKSDIQIQLDIPSEDFTTIINTTDPNPYNFYAGFEDQFYGGTTVYFTVLYEGYELIPVDNDSLIIDKSSSPIEEYILDLHVYLSVNHPPDKPINPSPADNAGDVSINPTLSVDVSDPDDDNMDVSFYDASDDSLIEIVNDVANGSSASVTWSGLTSSTTYQWYAIANDSEFETKSDTWSFTTNDLENIPPTVSITKPEKAFYIFNQKIFPRFIRLALIIGKITITADATDEDSGIEKVEFYINGNLKGNDTSDPYTYDWTRDRLRLFHFFFIKVIAYDNDGATAQDSMFVRKFL